jgi:hypothetical protein
MGPGAFHRGDRVVLIVDEPYGNTDLHAGMKGTVEYVIDSEDIFSSNNNAVCFDDFTGGHDCMGHASGRNNGWWLAESDISLDTELEGEDVISEEDIADEREVFAFIGIE